MRKNSKKNQLDREKNERDDEENIGTTLVVDRTLLSIAGTNAQNRLSLLSFNNFAGPNSLNDNAAAAGAAAAAARPAPAPAQTTADPLGPLYSALLLSLLASRLTGGGSPYPQYQYPYYSGYGGYYPYTSYYYSYYSRSPYYYYYG
ncbi:unnamed protein product [Cercopithifilaria johnstoni]|uniref:Uncharacterized protein n=1 Tax=Cercopithifilaria johnstoni TaxID=2874296 RepID=A0A8J2Q6C6_9BILA|nr:unnamed protein product [Cercopithifilaria johnstoni]